MSARRMYSVEELGALISAGGTFFVAGERRLLERLPRGRWTGGTIPYFMTDRGGTKTKERVCAMEIPDCASNLEIKVYDAKSLASVYKDAPDNGFTLITMPASSPTHMAFALEAASYDLFAARPLIGWISGVDLDELGREKPLVFDGRTGTAFTDAAIAMHLALPKGKSAEVGIVNIFEPSDGDVLTFREDTFDPVEVIVNGAPRRFVDYLREKSVDLKLPLVADCAGALVNVSFQSVDERNGIVHLYAPVFKGFEYRVAKPVGDYLRAFLAQKPRSVERIDFSCNCILNYLYADLENKKTEGFEGPITFGEVGYQLLNQTAVYLEITGVNLAKRLRDTTALRRQFNVLETLVDTIPSPVYFSDAAGRYRGCNKAFEEFAAKPRGEIIGKTAGEVFPGEGEMFGDTDAQALARQGRQYFELSRGERQYSLHRAAYHDDAGRAAGIVGVIYDVSELKATQSRLVHSQKMAAVGQLAAGVAHEINNPLTGVLGGIELLRMILGKGDRVPVEPDALAVLDDAEKAALRCRDIVAALLGCSRASKGVRQALDLGEVVRGVSGLVGREMSLHGIELVCELAPGLPSVVGDRQLIQQVVLNILGNAKDAIRAKGPAKTTKGRITCVTRDGEEGIVLEISDDGVGIPEAARARIFEPFFTTKAVGEGTGLGLSLAYDIVKDHAGEISVASFPGKGTTFTIRLPAARARPVCAPA